MPKSVFTLILILFTFAVSAQEKDQVNLVSSEVSFVIKNAGINVDGSMEGLTANILFNPKKPQKGSISGTLDPATIKTGIGMRDKHLKNEDYFDVENYPQIKMESNSLRKLQGNQYEGLFTLTIKDITREISLPFTVTEENDQFIFDTSFEINRQDFGLGDDSIILSDMVKINIRLTGTP